MRGKNSIAGSLSTTQVEKLLEPVHFLKRKSLSLPVSCVPPPTATAHLCQTSRRHRVGCALPSLVRTGRRGSCSARKVGELSFAQGMLVVVFLFLAFVSHVVDYYLILIPDSPSFTLFPSLMWFVDIVPLQYRR